MPSFKITSLIIIQIHFHTIFKAVPSAAQSTKFDPYQLNGGLVAAVAGRDFVLLASDTRLTNGGYGVNCRGYLSGRIWCASTLSSLSPSIEGSSSLPFQSNEPRNFIDWNRFEARWEPDGSLALPSKHGNLYDNWTDRSFHPEITTLSDQIMEEIEREIDKSTMSQLSPKSNLSFSSGSLPSQDLSMSPNRIMNGKNVNYPVLIGSAGCASDCESLKRRMRLELDALESSSMSSSFSFSHPFGGDSFFSADFSPRPKIPHGTSSTFSSGSGMGVQSVANLLQQILYGRRGFPYYSFCVVAGIDRENDDDDIDGFGMAGTGAVYVYDAIGSYERVAVGSAGTGRELLQPILDRLFSGTKSKEAKLVVDKTFGDGLATRDAMSVPATRQRMGVAGSLRPPVKTVVDCSWEEALQHIVRGYRSVSEREISVGDEVVVCVVRTPMAGGDGDVHSSSMVDVFRFPLKKH
mmetsp:Transcript_17306/g.36287  ORF Transcript_17306/g.36287 Transcript_17306/m.36287 type:complete len:464 (+) Transcript_17306:50-1441(+)